MSNFSGGANFAIFVIHLEYFSCRDFFADFFNVNIRLISTGTVVYSFTANNKNPNDKKIM